MPTRCHVRRRVRRSQNVEFQRDGKEHANPWNCMNNVVTGVEIELVASKGNQRAELGAGPPRFGRPDLAAQECAPRGPRYRMFLARERTSAAGQIAPGF